ncbi:type I secretion system permease/ATPase, partial [Roseovarius sp. D22-M7]
MKRQRLERGYEELREARRESRALYWFVGVFSVFANLLMLTGPLYMLQVYDRVLGSRSVETLIALSLLVVFLGIWIFHPWLGALALVGGGVLIGVALINQWVTRQPTSNANRASVASDTISDQMRGESEMLQSMGMREAAFQRWQQVRGRALHDQIRSADLGGTFTSTTKAFRLFLQSAMLGLGA